MGLLTTGWIQFGRVRLAGRDLDVICVGTDLSAVITWVGLGLSAAEPHAL